MKQVNFMLRWVPLCNLQKYVFGLEEINCTYRSQYIPLKDKIPFPRELCSHHKPTLVVNKFTYHLHLFFVILLHSMLHFRLWRREPGRHNNSTSSSLWYHMMWWIHSQFFLSILARYKCLNYTALCDTLSCIHELRHVFHFQGVDSK